MDKLGKLSQPLAHGVELERINRNLSPEALKKVMEAAMHGNLTAKLYVKSCMMIEEASNLARDPQTLRRSITHG